MMYIIYKITNKVNNKIYIGVHGTNDLHDSYMGSGISLKRAIKKYGKEHFIKEILHIFESIDEAYKLEETLVNDEFIARKDTYNMKLGGNRGPRNSGVDNPMYGRKHSVETRAKNSLARIGQFAGEKHPLYNKGHSDESKAKMSASRKGKKHALETLQKLKKSNGKPYACCLCCQKELNAGNLANHLKSKSKKS